MYQFQACKFSMINETYVFFITCYCLILLMLTTFAHNYITFHISTDNKSIITGSEPHSILVIQPTWRCHATIIGFIEACVPLLYCQPSLHTIISCPMCPPTTRVLSLDLKLIVNGSFNPSFFVRRTFLCIPLLSITCTLCEL